MIAAEMVTYAQSRKMAGLTTSRGEVSLSSHGVRGVHFSHNSIDSPHCTSTLSTVARASMEFQVDTTNRVPIYRQLMDQVRLAVARGRLHAHAQWLPLTPPPTPGAGNNHPIIQHRATLILHESYVPVMDPFALLSVHSVLMPLAGAKRSA